MPQLVEEKLKERNRLRSELTTKYRKQADVIRLYGIPSTAINQEIKELRAELKKVDKKSVGKDDDRTKAPRRSPKRKKAPWRCANSDCYKIMPSIEKSLTFNKRHYCCQSCAQSDAGIAAATISAKT
ncbi:hypothetical protein NST07_20775 [Paenibacillus sp. FSL L8-0340]|uniref:hypothetical protein n=1 Tax=Paenibacillus sp. FSL L8-0340 TaxID=2954685 RepID=UPI00315946B1